MSGRGLSSLALAAFLLAFACIFIGGAPRLIADCDTQIDIVLPGPVGAYLCGAEASATSQPLENVRFTRGETAAHMQRIQYSDWLRVQSHSSPGCDANGNVLCAVSYMRSVYQAFDLGDGFA